MLLAAPEQGMIRSLVALATAIILAACVPPGPGEPQTPTPASPTAVASPLVAVSPSPAPPSGPASAAPRLYLTVEEANSALARRDFSTAVRLYRLAAIDDSLSEPFPLHPVAPGPELRAFARFRIVMIDALVGQEEDARAVLEQMRRQDSGTAFLPLALVFWDTYGMTGDLPPACGRVKQLVEADPGPVLRSLNNWGAQVSFGPDDICKLP